MRRIRQNLFDAALDEMKIRIRLVASVVLPSLDRKRPEVDVWKAGAPFGMPDDALPRTDIAVKRRMKKLFDEAESLVNELKELPPPDAPSGKEPNLMKAMLEADQPFKDAL